MPSYSKVISNTRTATVRVVEMVRVTGNKVSILHKSADKFSQHAKKSCNVIKPINAKIHQKQTSGKVTSKYQSSSETCSRSKSSMKTIFKANVRL